MNLIRQCWYAEALFLPLSFVLSIATARRGVGVGGVVGGGIRAKIIRPEWIGPTRDSDVNRSDDSQRNLLEFMSPAASANQRRQFFCDERCGLSDDASTPANRIKGGSPSAPNQFPWMAFIVIDVPEFFTIKQTLCSATIIKPRYLLTAAHCVHYAKVLSIRAFVGYHYVNVTRFLPTGYERIVHVKRAFVHRLYNPMTMEHDIAVLELTEPIEFNDHVHTICLPDAGDEHYADGTKATIAGWGLAEAYGTMVQPQMLLEASATVIDTSVCKTYMHSLGIRPSPASSSSVVCTLDDAAQPCPGDSGGPLMTTTTAGINSGKANNHHHHHHHHNNNNNDDDGDGGGSRRRRYRQIGIVSWGVRCPANGFPSVYVRLANYLRWIESVSPQDVCSPAAPPRRE